MRGQEASHSGRHYRIFRIVAVSPLLPCPLCCCVCSVAVSSPLHVSVLFGCFLFCRVCFVSLSALLLFPFCCSVCSVGMSRLAVSTLLWVLICFLFYTTLPSLICCRVCSFSGSTPLPCPLCCHARSAGTLHIVAI